MPAAYIALQNGTAASNTFKTWNSTSVVSKGATLFADLADDAGSATGWSLATAADHGGAGGSEAVQGSSSGSSITGSGDAAWVDEAVITAQNHYVNGTEVAHLVFGGLDNAKTYTLKLWAAHGSTGRDPEFALNSSFTSSQALSVTSNTSTIVTFSGVSPASNQIDLYWRVNSGNTYGILAAIAFFEDAAAAGQPFPVSLHARRIATIVR